MEFNTIIIADKGGKEFFKETILAVFEDMGAMNVLLLGQFIPLPPRMLVALLKELESEGRLKSMNIRGRKQWGEW